MPIIKDTVLEKDIKQGDIKNVYFLYGAEYTSVENVVHAIIKKTIDPEFSAFNLQRFDEKSKVFEISDAYMSIPFMGGKRCIVVTNLEIDALDDKEYKELINMLDDITDTIVLIFAYINKDIDIKKSKYKKTMDIIGSSGVVCELSQKDKAYIRRYIEEACKKNNVQIDLVVTNVVIERCKENLSRVKLELSKMIMCCLDGKITMDIVKLLCSQTIEDSVFDLANSIIYNRYKESFLLLNNLLWQKVEPIAIVGALNMAFSDMYRAKLGAMKNYMPSQIIKDFSYNPRREFVIKNAISAVNKYPKKRFQSWFNILLDADKQLKSSRMNNKLILEQMIGKLLQA